MMNSNLMLIFHSTLLSMIMLSMLIPIMFEKIHPLYLMSFLIVLTIFVSMFISLMLKKTLISFMTFMAMVSGMLIMFLYFSSMINNEFYKFKASKFSIFLIFMMVIFLMILFKSNLYLEMNSLIWLNKKSMIYLIYVYPFSALTMLVMIHLLVTMIFTTKISTVKFKSMRTTKY